MLTENDLKELREQYEIHLKDTFQRLEKDIKNIFVKAVDETVYKTYTPKYHNRENRLKDVENLKIDYDKDTVFLSYDTSKLNYKDISGNNVYEHVPYWIETGVFYSIFNRDLEYDYNFPREYLEEAKRKIEKKYPELHVVVIKEPTGYILR